MVSQNPDHAGVSATKENTKGRAVLQLIEAYWDATLDSQLLCSGGNYTHYNVSLNSNNAEITKSWIKSPDSFVYPSLAGQTLFPMGGVAGRKRGNRDSNYVVCVADDREVLQC